jgi:hypothetical protein
MNIALDKKTSRQVAAALRARSEMLRAISDVFSTSDITYEGLEIAATLEVLANLIGDVEAAAITITIGCGLDDSNKTD